MAADRQAELAAVLPENREIFARIFQNSDSDSDLENVDPGANVVGDINESDLDFSDVESSESDRSANPSDVNVDSSSSSTSSDDAIHIFIYCDFSCVYTICKSNRIEIGFIDHKYAAYICVSFSYSC